MAIPLLSTSRLQLSPATRADLDALWEIWRDPEVRRYLFDDVRVTRERAAEALNNCFSHSDEGLGLWTMSIREDSSLIGCAGLLRTQTTAEYDKSLVGGVEPLVSLSPSVWGRGYAHEALREVLNYGFKVLDFKTIFAVNDVPNEASARLVARLGFRTRSECDGPHYRMRTYVLTAEEFAQSSLEHGSR